MYSFSCVLWAIFWSFPLLFFVCALGDFLVLSASVLRQIARYLPHHTSGNASKTHSKSSHDKLKQFLNSVALSGVIKDIFLKNEYILHPLLNIYCIHG